MRRTVETMLGAGGAFEAVIVVLTLVFSVLPTWSWRHRGELLSGYHLEHAA